MRSPFPRLAHKTRLKLDPLENRAVPALLAQLEAGVLGIWGTDGNDEIIVRQIAGRLSVDTADILVNGSPRTSVSTLAVNRIEIACGAGDDAVYLNSQTVDGQQAIKKPAFVWGEDGSDWVEGGQGKDYIDLGTGEEDVAYGHGGNDTMIAEGVSCFLYGDEGNDRIEAECDEMVLDGGSGNDRVQAYGDGLGWLDGGLGNDTLTGGDGNDVISGGPGHDRMFGYGGADDLDGGNGTDIMWGSWEPKVETLDDGIDTFRDVFDPYRMVYRGTTPSDILQMGSPLCSTLASMSAAAWAGFSLRDSLHYAGGTTYGVALFNPDAGEWEGHSVDFDGTWTDLDANVPRSSRGAVLPEFWPVLIARATLQERGVDLSNTDPAYVEANYRAESSDILTRLTSWDSIDVDMADATPQILRREFYDGQAIVASTYDADPVDMTPGIVPNHSYALIDIIRSGGQWYVYLHNPWGRDFDPATRATPAGLDDGLIVLTWDQFVADFYGYAQTA
jgi:hypothetical protein